MLMTNPTTYRRVNAIPVIPGYTPQNRPKPAPVVKRHRVSEADKTLMLATIFITLALVIVPGVLPLFV